MRRLSVLKYHHSGVFLWYRKVYMGKGTRDRTQEDGLQQPHPSSFPERNGEAGMLQT